VESDDEMMKEYEIQKKNEIGNWVCYSLSRCKKLSTLRLKAFKVALKKDKFRLVCIESRVIAR
jgi:hypothetical protein